MKVPFFRALDQHDYMMDSILKRVEDVVRMDRFILGPVVEKFEAKFAQEMGAPHAVGVNSGSDALLLALRLLDLQPEDEVIVPVFAFVGVPSAILRVGGTPMFVDVDPLTGLMDMTKMEEAITPNTKAIIALHLYGKSLNMNSLMEIARKHNLAVIEDCTQAAGASFHGRKLGTFGMAGCYSLDSEANLGGIGDAGIIVTDTEERALRLRKLRDHGKMDETYADEIGYNSRMDAIQAAILSQKMDDLDDTNAERIENARFYNRCFADANAVLPEVGEEGTHVFNMYTLQVAQRDALEIYLNDKKIGSAIQYPIPLHLQPCFEFFEYKEGDFPQAEQLSKRVISLPIFPGLKRKEIQYVAQAVVDFLTG